MVDNRKRVITYMKEHEKAYPSDISEELEIEFEEVMEITKLLIEEGIVEFVDDKKG